MNAPSKENGNEKVDIKENRLAELSSELLDILLSDHSHEKATRCQRNITDVGKGTVEYFVNSTVDDGEVMPTRTHKRRNIIWASADYEHLGRRYKLNPYQADCEIKANLITGRSGEVIRPRVEKSKVEQKGRTKGSAEVFTPSWIVEKQVNLAWETVTQDVQSDEVHNEIHNEIDAQQPSQIWQKFVKQTWLEIACGEGPYICSRYDAVSGDVLPLNKRVGFLDRKLALINQHTESEAKWFEWVKIAYKTSYGFEFQGDNLLLARENALYTFRDYYDAKFNPPKSGKRKDNSKHWLNPDNAHLLKMQKQIAQIISWNIFQMDGLKYVVPESCIEESITLKQAKPLDLNDLLSAPYEEVQSVQPCQGCAKSNPKLHTGRYQVIMNWQVIMN